MAERSGRDAGGTRPRFPGARLHRHLADLLAVALFAAGCALAVLYASVNTAPGESGSAALTLLRRGFIGDPYLVPTGPTAHVGPVLTGYLAAMFAVFGPNTAAARVALGVVASAAYALSARIAVRTCGLPGRPPWARWLAAALLVVLSTMLLFEAVVPDRQWDQPFAALVLVAGLWTLERGRGDGRPYRAEVRTAVLAGVGGLLSPATLPPLLGSLALLAWSRRRLQRPLLALAVGVMITAAFLVPWGLRNEAVLGRFILTRSNFALEFATGNASGAQGWSGSGAGEGLHPHDSIAAATEVARVGEVAYMREVGILAWRRVLDDPARFLRLSLRRAWFCFVPAPVMVGWYPVLGTGLPWALLAGFGGLTLLAVAVAVALGPRRPDRLPAVALLFVVLPLAPYVLTHVNLRYLFVTRPDDVVLVTLAAVEAAPWFARRGFGTARGTALPR